MRKLAVYISEICAGTLEEKENGSYTFSYKRTYSGPAVSLTMPNNGTPYIFDTFPPFFEGLLPEGMQLEALLRSRKIDRNDLFSQLTAVGHDMVGAVSVIPFTPDTQGDTEA